MFSVTVKGVSAACPSTPTGATVNAILTSYPDVYLFGCLIEAAIFTQDELATQRYLQLYNASVAGPWDRWAAIASRR